MMYCYTCISHDLQQIPVDFGWKKNRREKKPCNDGTHISFACFEYNDAIASIDLNKMMYI